jgi:chromate transporter
MDRDYRGRKKKGAAAHISMMEHEVVTRRGWMTREEFLDLLGATNLAPGPTSTKMALFIGYVLGGLPGAAVATLGIFLPAFAFVALMGPVTLQFARPALTNGPTVTLFLVGVAILATIRINAAWLVLAGGLLGVAFG